MIHCAAFVSRETTSALCINAIKKGWGEKKKSKNSHPLPKFTETESNGEKC